MIQLDPEFIQRMQELHGPGKVFIKECKVCGWTRWSSTHTTESNEVVLIPLEDECSACFNVYQRAPELAAWVHGCLNQIACRMVEKLRKEMDEKLVVLEQRLLRRTGED